MRHARNTETQRKIWIALAIFGAVLVVLRLGTHVKLLQLQQVGQEVTGVVREDRSQTYYRPRGPDRIVHRAAVAYMVSDQPYESVVSTPGPPTVGAPIALVYDPRNPQNVAPMALVKEGWEDAFEASMTGIGLMIIGGAAYWTTRKKE